MKNEIKIYLRSNTNIIETDLNSVNFDLNISTEYNTKYIDIFIICYTYTQARARARKHARTHTHTHAHIHTYIFFIFIYRAIHTTNFDSNILHI